MHTREDRPRPSNRDERPARDANPPRTGAAPRSERPAYSPRPERPRTERGDGPERGAPASRSSSPPRFDYHGRSERPAPRPYAERSERPARSDRPERSDHAQRSEQPRTSDRPTWALRGSTPSAESSATIDERDAQRRREVRIYGRAACLGVAEDRFEAIRKLYVTRQRARELGPLLARLAAARIGFNEVEDEDLERLTSTQHHEGVACDILRKEQPALDELLAALARESGPACLVALDGVGNPHNFGAILRSAVHFGARAVLIPEDSTLTLAGAVYRVAEGAAERVPVVRYSGLKTLRGRGFTLVATAASGERKLYEDPLPKRSILLFGAEGAGLSREALNSADARYAIPGSGRIDSLNVAQAVAVVLGEHWRGAMA